MNTSIHAEQPGRTTGFQPLPMKMLTYKNSRGEAETTPVQRYYATGIEATNRDMKHLGTESAAESEAAIKLGKGAQVHIGPVTSRPSSSTNYLFTVPIKPTPPPPPVIGKRVATTTHSSSGNADELPFRSLGDDEYYEGYDERPKYRGGMLSGDNDDGVAADDRVGAGAPLPTSMAKEARLSIGQCLGDAPSLPISNHIAAPGVCANVDSLSIMCIRMNTKPSYECVVEGARFLKQCYERNKPIGDEVKDRLSKKAMELGITTKEAPTSKKMKIAAAEQNYSKGLNASSSIAEPDVAIGQPYIAGVSAASTAAD